MSEKLNDAIIRSARLDKISHWIADRRADDSTYDGTLAIIKALLDGAEISYSGTGSDFDPHWTVYKPSLPATPTEPCAECGGAKVVSHPAFLYKIPCPICTGKREEE